MIPVLRASALAAALAASATIAEAKPLDVVATFSVLGDMTAEIGGDRVAVHTLVGPDGDTHVYQPTPADAEAIAKADLVVVNGLGLEGFITRLLEAAEYKGPVVTAAAAVKPRTGFVEEDEPAGEAEDHDHDHAHDGVDPHAWQSLKNGMAYAAAIRDGLCKVDPDGCPAFTERTIRFTADMAAIDADARARFAAIPEARRIVITSHDAFGYFGEAYGITFLAPQGLSTDSEPGAAAVAGIIGQIRKTGVTTLFLENISDPRLMEQIAAETGAKVGPPLYSDALSPADGPAATYLAMMRHNIDALAASMTGGS